jgi:hypothetical protein
MPNKKSPRYSRERPFLIYLAYFFEILRISDHPKQAKTLFYVVKILHTNVKHFLVTTKKKPLLCFRKFCSDGNKLSSEDKTLPTEDKNLKQSL